MRFNFKFFLVTPFSVSGFRTYDRSGLNYLNGMARCRLPNALHYIGTTS